MHPGIFITGTDTGVGKTFASALIMRGLKQSQGSVGYWKPLQTGHPPDDDTAWVREFSGLTASASPPPFLQYSPPIAPSLAARRAAEEISLISIYEAYEKLPASAWVVEGAGGLLTPIASGATMRELAVALHLPILIVASTRLGTINHTRMTVEAALTHNLKIAGVVLMDHVGMSAPHAEDAKSGPLRELIGEIEDHLPVRVVLTVPLLDPLDRSATDRFDRELHFRSFLDEVVCPVMRFPFSGTLTAKAPHELG